MRYTILFITIIVLFCVVVALVSYKKKYNQLMFKKINKLLNKKYIIKLNNNIINDIDFLKDKAVYYDIFMNEENKTINILNKKYKR